MNGKNVGVWRDRAEVAHLTQPELLASMVAEAREHGYEPDDLIDGTAQLYFRGYYRIQIDDLTGEVSGDSEFVKDGYWLSIRSRETQ